MSDPLRMPRPDCTGLTAGWCPVHGTCICPTGLTGSDVLPAGWFAVALNDPHCPLHGLASAHPAIQHGGADECRRVPTSADE